MDMQDEENWSATHRFSGKLWVASGVLCMLCGLFGESIAALVLYIVSIMAAAIVSILYSYLFYKKKMEAGEKLKIQYNKKTIVIYVIVSVLVIIFTIWTLFWGGIDISFHDNVLLLRHRDGVIIQWIMSRLTVSHTKKIYFKMGMIAEQMVWET